MTSEQNMTVIEQIQNKLSHNFLVIPPNYYTFCLTAYYLVKDGEDLNALLTLVTNLADSRVSLKMSVDTFTESCSQEFLTFDLKEIYQEHMKRYQILLDEIDAEPRAQFEEGEQEPEWM